MFIYTCTYIYMCDSPSPFIYRGLRNLKNSGRGDQDLLVKMGEGG